MRITTSRKLKAEFTRRQNEMAQRCRHELSEKRAILVTAGRIQN
nr:MAG TPA: hypothetical protein [Caudoviricetes sp.]